MRTIVYYCTLCTVEVWIQLVQGAPKEGLPGLVKVVTAVAYHSCLNLPRAFSQPGKHSFGDPCSHDTWYKSFIAKLRELPIGLEFMFHPAVWKKLFIIEQAIEQGNRKKGFNDAGWNKWVLLNCNCSSWLHRCHECHSSHPVHQSTSQPTNRHIQSPFLIRGKRRKSSKWPSPPPPLFSIAPSAWKSCFVHLTAFVPPFQTKPCFEQNGLPR